MGAIYDRTQEHLGSSDQMVIRTRKRLIDAARALRDHGRSRRVSMIPASTRCARVAPSCRAAPTGSRPRASCAGPASRIPGSAARCSAACRPSSRWGGLERDRDFVTVPADAPLDATAVTRSLNRAVLDALPFADTEDFDDARRGFLGTLPEVEINNAQGRVVWSLRDYAFLAAEAPPTVNPSLWRQARLNLATGSSRSRTGSIRSAASTSPT